MKDTNNNINNSLLCAQKEKLIQAIKKIKHEIDDCYEAERDAFVDALEVENRFEEIEREIQAEFQNLHRFLYEEEETDLERLRKERDRRVKILKEREKKIAMQSRDLEKAIETLNCKLREDDSPKLLKRTSVIFEEDKVLPDENPDEKNPKCFHFYYCLMGSEAFTHGRHYWEVEVKGKTAWRVGVARADIPRGEMDSSSTLNGLWTLSLRHGSITACTHPKPTKVVSHTPPIRIGIFLDCDKEEVSFYNAVTMNPLFSFDMGSVLEPLYPFFNPCDTDQGKNCAPLSIFHPSL
ncbi:zinc-binding A33-like protein [Labeo rohita]|uniref:Zinc-binding A33-like protein n=1 Tax=Labeo rohita TaxID=84645 RepID=A0A498LBU3_LABRO|nr:zinc-binding A33-like protein [Labeo rohita]